jgi:PP-loop superfamily ATP-utilizing enzyme
VDPEQVAMLMEAGTRAKVERYMKSIGYESVDIDPEGYRQGKLNDPLLKG